MGAPIKSGAARRTASAPQHQQQQRTPQRKEAKKAVPPRNGNTRGAAATTARNTAAASPNIPLAGSTVSSSTSSSTPYNFALHVAEQERAVAAIRTALPPPSNREELRKDPIYRVMHTMPRSDVLEVVRSRFAAPHCTRAAAYFDQSYMANPLRRLRLQMGCDGPTGLHLFFSRIAAHRYTLRVLDLSRNRLSAEDVALLCNLLGLVSEGSVAAASLVPHAVADKSAGVSASPTQSALEMVDLSYNTKIGNDGAVHLLRALRRCPTIRALLLRSVGVDDDGAVAVAETIRHWPAPLSAANGGGSSDGIAVNALVPQTATATKFLLSLNENYIGARGTYVLGKGLPGHVSLTLSKQRLAFTKDRKRSGD